MITMVTFQQSRFLALVSNGERLSELSEKAANSQDAATLQANSIATLQNRKMPLKNVLETTIALNHF